MMPYVAFEPVRTPLPVHLLARELDSYMTVYFGAVCAQRRSATSAMWSWSFESELQVSCLTTNQLAQRIIASGLSYAGN